jgi:serine/threonine protein kinase
VSVAGRYRVLEVLGSGGFGSVFKAADEVLGRVVAVKVADRIDDSDPVSLERFRLEARAAAVLRHPSIPTVFDSGGEGEVEFSDGSVRRFAFIVMEYVDGPNLKALAASGIHAERSVAVVLDVLAALGHAHAQGVWHRDVKPANIVVPAEGPAKLVDFGIAKLQDATALTAGAQPATYLYASPEQIEGGKPVDGRTDLYSAGCVLYELLTRRRAFDGDSLPSVALAHFNTVPRPPAELDPRLPRGLSDVVMRAIARDPADRYQTAAEFAQALRTAIPAPGAQPPDPPGSPAAAAQTADAAPAASPNQAYPAGRPPSATGQPTQVAPPPAPGGRQPAPAPAGPSHFATGQPTKPYPSAAQPVGTARPAPWGQQSAGAHPPQSWTAAPPYPQPAQAGPRAAAWGYPAGPAGGQYSTADSTMSPAAPPGRGKGRRTAALAVVITLAVIVAALAATIAIPSLRQAIWDRSDEPPTANANTDEDPDPDQDADQSRSPKQAPRDAEGEVVESTTADVLAIKVGDCTGSMDDGQVAEILLIPCGQAHSWEAYASVQMVDGDYPADARDQADAYCLAEFALFIGLDYNESIYDVTFLYPTQETWDFLDDREILCLVGGETGDLIGSLKGAAN